MMDPDSPGHAFLDRLRQLHRHVVLARDKASHARNALTVIRKAVAEADAALLAWLMDSLSTPADDALRDGFMKTLLARQAELRHDIAVERRVSEEYERLEGEVNDYERDLRNLEAEMYPTYTTEVFADIFDFDANFTDNNGLKGDDTGNRDVAALRDKSYMGWHGHEARRGRGQRKNRSYWNAQRRNPYLNPFKRDCLFGDTDGGLTEPAIAQLDSTADIPFCVSLQYLKTIGKEDQMTTDVKHLNRYEIRGRNVCGIVRNMAFRLKGTSVTFRRNFIVADMLDDLVDVIFGWKFMASDLKVLLEKASSIISDSLIGIRDAVSNVSTKFAKVASTIQSRASDFIGRVASPSPPYSLCDVLAPNLYL